MFSHVMVGANDIEESKVFYDNLLGVLGAILLASSNLISTSGPTNVLTHCITFS